MKPRRRAASLPHEMSRSLADRRLVAIALAFAVALAGCSSAPEPRTRPPTTLAEINRALSWRFADVELVGGVVMRGLRGVHVTPERLVWLNERGQLREMAIGDVTRIVLRGRDPAAKPPTAGAELMEDPPHSPPEPEYGAPLEGSFEGGSAVLAGVLYGALFLASLGDEAPGVLIYEAPVTRYLTSPSTASSEASEMPPPDGAPPH